MKREEKKIKAVDVTDDALMVAEGLRNPMLRGRDKSLWQKTEKEREQWKRVRHFKAPNYQWAPPTKDSRFKARLIVCTKGLEKTTYSHTCGFEEVGYILSKYKTENSAIVKAFWNGKEINPENIHKAIV